VREEIDAVVVATPHSLHAPIAAEAFAARKHVLVQKPMATRREDADRLVEAYHKSGRVGMALPYLFSPAFVAGLTSSDRAPSAGLSWPTLAWRTAARAGNAGSITRPSRMVARYSTWACTPWPL
jgi:hypothetical protein